MLLALALTVPWHLRARHPVIDLRILDDQLFRTTQLSLLPTGAAFLGVLYLYPYLYPQFLQTGLGYDALHSGLATFPEALGMLTAAQLAPLLHDRVGPSRLMAAGGTAATGVVVFLVTEAATLPSAVLYPSRYLLGCSVGRSSPCSGGSPEPAGWPWPPLWPTAASAPDPSPWRLSAGARRCSASGSATAGSGTAVAPTPPGTHRRSRATRRSRDGRPHARRPFMCALPDSSRRVKSRSLGT
ncbi:hypothetical protein ACIRBZ_36325 [Streptomyces sp. NPDC094038]|uniref:hypothetical protein n=1 Tax=Streptomyces sp. NPDC094038 TaxID=3366055 RepID=UPI003820F917